MQQIRKVMKDVLMETGSFSERWYRTAYSVKGRSREALVDHFLREGIDHGFSPHPLFDPEWYLSTYQDVRDAGMMAVDHFFSSGASEARLPSAFYDPAPALQLAADQRLFNLPCGLLSVHGQDATSLELFQFFDPMHYDTGASRREANETPLEHFFTVGLQSGQSPHRLLEEWPGIFDGTLIDRYKSFRQLFLPDAPDQSTHEYIHVPFYRSQADELSCHPTVHYLRNWQARTVWPHPLLDPEHLAQSMAQSDNVDPVSAYLRAEEAGAISPNALFDIQTYTEEFATDFESGEAALGHYMRRGHLAEYAPSDQFGQKYYVKRAGGHLREGWPALADYLHNGEAVGGFSTPPKPFLDPALGRSIDELIDATRAFSHQAPETPAVTVLIPTFNNVIDTLRCIYSLLSSNERTPFIIHVVDDFSTDGSDEILKNAFKDMEKVQFFQNERNLGFLLSVNKAGSRVDTPYLYLLNNDTYVLPGFLDRLVDTFDRNTGVGAVGGKLLFPTGMLQEAGGVIFRDGSAANFGRNDDPLAPQYNFLRDVDYLSAAALLVRTSSWRAVGGFSEHYAPAYYEDTDFAMKLRAYGERVMYQPRSTVVHIEGATCGTDTSGGVKLYQSINKAKFHETWKDELDLFGEPGDLARPNTDRRVRARILVIDAELPMPDRDSGSVTTFHVLRLLTELGFRVTFMPANLQYWGAYAAPLAECGVEVICMPYFESGLDYIRQHSEEFDSFWISRVPTATEYYKAIKSVCPGAPIVFDTIDIHHLRLIREAELYGSSEKMVQALELKPIELGFIRDASATVVVSDYEVQYITDEIGPFPHVVLPLIYSDYKRSTGFQDRSGIAFVGSFRHPPNVDAVRYLCNEIWPLVLAEGFEGELHIIGSYLPSDLLSEVPRGVRLVGYVEDLEAYLSRIRATVAPLRYGAGVKGKVGNSMRMGVPVVATPVAAEGMGLEAGQHLLEATDPFEFARNIIRLHEDEALWTRLSEAGQSYAAAQFGLRKAHEKLDGLMRAILPNHRLPALTQAKASDDHSDTLCAER